MLMTHDIYITTPEFNKLKLVQANLITKTDFDNKLSSLNRKIFLNKTRHLLTEKELKKLKSLDLSYFIGKVILMKMMYKMTDDVFSISTKFRVFYTEQLNNNKITKWKSKGLSNESIEVDSTSDNTLTLSVNYYEDKLRLRFTGNVLQQKTVTYNHKKLANLYVVYEITNFHGIDNYPTLTNALFRAVKLTKNSDIDKYKYFGYGIGFDGSGSFPHPSRRTEKNVVIF